MRTLLIVLPPALFVLGGIHLFLLPAQAGVLNTMVAWVVAVVLLLLRTGPLDPSVDERWTYPVALLTIIMLAGSIWLLLHSVGLAVYTMYLAALLLGSGFFIISVPVFLVAVVATAAAFAGAIIIHGFSQEWISAGVALGVILFLSTAFLLNRMRTLYWLSELRRRDDLQKASMEEGFHRARQLEEQARALAESAFEGIFVHENGKVLDLNTAACRLLGVSPEKARGANLRDFVSEDQREKYDVYQEDAKAREGEIIESRWRLFDGREIEVEARSREIPFRSSTAEVLVVRDVTERRRDQREREAIRNRLEQILENAGEGIYGLDPQGRIMFANRAAAQLIGMSAGEMIGLDAHSLFHHSRQDKSPFPVEQCPIIQSIVRQRVIEVTDDVFWHQDGSPFPVAYVASPLVQQGKVEGGVVVFQDTTQRVEVDRMKDELISVVGHELKTPLASIHGSLRLIEGTPDDSVPPRFTQLVRIAARNTERLSRMVNDLLDVERIRAGRLELDLQPCQARSLVHEAVQGMQGFAKTHEVVVVESGEEVTLWVDRDRMIQALTNLLSNAIKFSPKRAEVRVESRAERDQVRFTVQDRGPGIPKEKQGLLFKRFSQLDTSDSRQKGGSGLGLLITRSLVEAHGGQVGLESREGQGSTFFILVPLKKDKGRGPRKTR